MKKVLSVVAVALLVVGMTGCCCLKDKSCPEGCTKSCCEKPAE
ncbi:MAG: hypothetical protein V3V05_05975 [Pontiella sp.]